jgi:hypothetical protein
MTKLFRSTRLLAGVLAALALVTPALAQGQTAVLTGRVVSEQGQPLPGANVFVPELNISVSTNQSGAFTITVPAARVNGQPIILRARAIGYQPGSRPLSLTAGSQTVDFDLRRDVTELSAVVVTGVTKATEQIKVPFTVTQVDTTQMPVTGSNPLTQLQGKIPGALVVNASGRPGASPSIVLRGPVSLNATGRSQEPLYLLDGVPRVRPRPRSTARGPAQASSTSPPRAAEPRSRASGSECAPRSAPVTSRANFRWHGPARSRSVLTHSFSARVRLPEDRRAHGTSIGMTKYSGSTTRARISRFLRSSSSETSASPARPPTTSS